MKSNIFIPSRLGSKRFPSKMLEEVSGKSLIQLTYENVKELADTKLIDKIMVATPDNEIEEHCKERAIPVQRTFPSVCGTHTCLMAHREQGMDSWKGTKPMINVQGDTPDVSLQGIVSIAKDIARSGAYGVRSLYYKAVLSGYDSLNRVKVTTNSNDHAMWFSRLKIPHGGLEHKIHVGVYGFPGCMISSIEKLYDRGQTSNNDTENLEQLMWLEQQIRISLYQIPPCTSIDTEDDLIKYSANR